ncbi:MAG TPA: methyltransferase domain-containing protein [Polyangiaceae bacterium]
MQVSKERGISKTVEMSLTKLKDFAAYPVMKRRNASKTFLVGGKPYHYFVHHYNSTWRNERAVEVPLAAELLTSAAPGARCLEVGNVLNYYLREPRTVVDKYEPSRGVINQDILEFGAPGSFDVIVSISTLEHVGWDENPREPGKVIRALNHMKALLAPGGHCLVTFPLGYNSELDDLVFASKLEFRKIHYLKRLNLENDWLEVERDAVRSVAYGSPFQHANAIFVGID